MNTTIIQQGQLDLRQEHFRFDVDALTKAITSFGNGFNNNNNYIIYGCSLSVSGGNTTLNEGAIFINGEIYQVEEQNLGTLDPEIIATTRYFDLLESFDPDGLKDFLDGSIKNTRKIRKAHLVQSPTVFVDILFGTIEQLNDDINESIDDVQTNVDIVQSNLDTHEAIGNNHDFLPNHLNDGDTYDVTLTPTIGVTIDTSDARYYSRYYILGNLVFYEFALPTTVTGMLNSIILGFETTFPRGNGRGQVFKTTDANFDSNSNPVDFSLLEDNWYSHTNYPSGQVRSIRIAQSGAANVPIGTYVIFGQLVFKKVNGDNGLPI